MSNRIARILTLLLCPMAVFGIASASAGGATPPVEEPIWPGAAPDLEAFEPLEDETHHVDEPKGRLKGAFHVSTPTLSVMTPSDAPASGTTIVVFPGGGFRSVVLGKEGYDVADWLNSLGIAAVVVKYRTRPRDLHWDDEPERNERVMAAIAADARRAIRIVRVRAPEWGGDPNKIGVMGFSAGGLLAIQTMVSPLPAQPDSKDPAGRVGSRPDFACLVYPGIEEKMVFKDLPQDLPPTFVVNAADDSKTAGMMCLAFYAALQQASAPSELHLFQRGEHGFGTGVRGGAVAAWMTLFQTWLGENGLLVEKP
ncbi:alpha/beta hydrolase [Candidatus Sumerlaeota bacterium]|nr:alpha/beta hydrolase [Candidatus Sumerlaeota bacterium]